MTKLTARLRSQILAEYQAGASPTELARRYGVAVRSINNWRRRAGIRSQLAARWDRAVYNARDDFERSINTCYEAVRERVKAGGPPWTPPR